MNTKILPSEILKRYQNFEYVGVDGDYIIAKATSKTSDSSVELRILNLDDPKVLQRKTELVFKLLLHVTINSTLTAALMSYQFFHEYSSAKTCFVFEDETTRQARVISRSLAKEPARVRSKYTGLNVETRGYQQQQDNSNQNETNETFYEKMRDWVDKYVQKQEEKIQKFSEKFDANTKFQTIVLFRDFDGKMSQIFQFAKQKPTQPAQPTTKKVVKKVVKKIVRISKAPQNNQTKKSTSDSANSGKVVSKANPAAGNIDPTNRKK